MLKNLLTMTVLIVGLAGLSTSRADEPSGHPAGDHPEHMQLPTVAVAVLIPTAGNQVGGSIVLKKEQDGVRITGKVTGLSPGEHGFHIHQFGDLRAPDGTAAGGHYDPDGHEHGGPDAAQHHAGDLGNIKAGPDGVATVDIVSKNLKVHFVVGRSIVVHAGADDFKSQPSGASGPRVAVGIIGLANPE